MACRAHRHLTTRNAAPVKGGACILDVYDWPLVVGKEVMDNALDACEEAEVAPDITVIVDAGTIIIQDNAGGIDTETIESILDYSIRVSSREAYVSPTRGAQGNALKNHSRHGLCARSQARQRCQCGGSHDHRVPRRRASHRVPGRSHQQPAQDHPHHGGLSGQARDQAAVSGGWFCCFLGFIAADTGGQSGQNDPAQMFQQIMQQVTGG